MRTPEHIILSRTDSIGDVMLTLPTAGLLKQHFPGVRITFIGRSYTAPVLACCEHVDGIITLEELAMDNTNHPVERLRSLDADTLVHVFPQRDIARWGKRAAIPHRIGTSHRLWHWSTCNERVPFSRRKSNLHEAQLNVKLLAPLGVEDAPSLASLRRLYGFKAPLPTEAVRNYLRPDRINVVLHPGSRGSAAEWGLSNFAALISMMDPSVYQCIITGTAIEREGYATHLPLDLPHVVDAGGAITLEQLVMLIGGAQALVAASTGPLHIAAATGIRAIGLYASRRPIHPGRWAPLGADAHALVNDVDCTDCAAGKACTCIGRIDPQRVMDLIIALR
ncbi:MAG: glycosyltransferase family 9 protein [Flavobacteriales bacterium]|nr:glycosyltransferase family 9 protein [Flavobacteriales bacterium]